MKRVLAGALSLLLICGATSLCSDITTTTGIVYHDAKVTGVDVDGLRVTHRLGVAKIPFEELPESLRTQYHYDKQKVDLYRQQILAGQKLAAQKQAAEEQRRQQDSQESRKWIVAQVEQHNQQLTREKMEKETQRKNELIGSWVGFLSITLVAALIYFVPTFVGLRKHNAVAIFVLNFFLGWTFIGWVVALVWACTKEPKGVIVHDSV